MKGAEAKVFMGVWKNRPVAIKRFAESALDFRPDEIRKEVALLRSIFKILKFH